MVRTKFGPADPPRNAPAPAGSRQARFVQGPFVQGHFRRFGCGLPSGSKTYVKRVRPWPGSRWYTYTRSGPPSGAGTGTR